MTRSFVLIPMLLFLACAIAVAVCHAIGRDPRIKELIAAASACLIAGELALIPLVLTRGGNQASIAQAALLGTVIHLFVSITLAAVAIFGRVGFSGAFLYWLLGLYCVTLVGLVIAFARAVRSAPMAHAK